MGNLSSQELLLIVPRGQDGPCLITIARGRDDYLAKAQVDSPSELQLVAASGGNWIAKRKLDERLGDRKLWGDWYDVDFRSAAKVLRETSGQVVQDLRNREITGRSALGLAGEDVHEYRGAEPAGWNEYGDPIYTEAQEAKIRELKALGVKLDVDVCREEGIPYPRELDTEPGRLA